MSNNDKRIVNLHLTPEMYESVALVAEENYRPISQQLRLFIAWGLERYNTEISENNEG